MDQLFYSNNIIDDLIYLNQEESFHAIKVLRKNKGDNIYVTDGLGVIYLGEIQDDDVKKCVLKIINEKVSLKKINHYIHIAIAPTKNHDRIEWFVEKAIEIGIQEISFLQTKRTERKKIKIDRIKKRAISSMKQSLQGSLPIINEMLDFSEFVDKCNNYFKYVGYLGGEKVDLLTKTVNKNSNCCVMIGPEGDFTNEEIYYALNNGFNCISLGGSRLRTETAGMVACNILNVING